MGSCIIYIQRLSKDEKVQDALEAKHNSLIKEIKASKLFNSYNEHEFLPPPGGGRYAKAKNFLAAINEREGMPVVNTSFTKATGKEHAFVNVTNFLPSVLKEMAPPKQGELFFNDKPLKQINDEFDENYKKFLRGELPPNFIFNLGKPSSILQQMGFPDEQISINLENLQAIYDKHISTKSHDKDLENYDLFGLVKAIHIPASIIESNKNYNSYNIISSINSSITGKPLVVILEFKTTKRGMELNIIRTLYGRDENNGGYIDDINDDKLIYTDKEKLLDILNGEGKPLLIPSVQSQKYKLDKQQIAAATQAAIAKARAKIQNHINNVSKEDVKYYQLSLNKDIISSKASPKTLEAVKALIQRIGVDYQKVKSIVIDGKTYDANGIADIMHSLIQITEGKEDVALVEEAMHFGVEILKQTNPALYRQMFNKIGQYNLYNTVLDSYRTNKQYQNEDGSLNIPKIKDEAIGKLLAEYYIKSEEGQTEKPELLLFTKTWLQQFIDWVRGLFNKAGINPFEQGVEEINNTNNTLYQLNTPEFIEKSNKSLDEYLLNYLKDFNVKSKEFNDLKDKLGIDALGATDIINKLIWLAKDRNIETVPEEFGHMITFLMGEKNPLINDLLKEIQNWSEFNKINEQYLPIYKNDKQVRIEAIGKLIAKALVKNYKAYGTDKGLIQKALDIINSFIDKILKALNITINDVYDYPTKIADKIALEVLAGNKIIDKPTLFEQAVQNISPLDYKTTVAENPLAASLIDRFTTGEFSNFKLSGSLAIAKQGLIYRPNKEPIHDLDFRGWGSDEDFEHLVEEVEKLGGTYIHSGWTHSDFVTYSFLIPIDGKKITDVKRDNKGWIESYTVDGDRADKTNSIGVDFFWYKNQPSEHSFENVSTFNDIFKGKLFLSKSGSNERLFQREKDQKDFILFKPSYIGTTDSSMIYYQLNNNTSNEKSLKDKIEEQRAKYDLQKVVKDATDDEVAENYYTINKDGKTVKTQRTTEYAKSVVEAKGGKALSERTPQQKKEDSQAAELGTKMHADAENIVDDATNEDGTLKPVNEIKLLHKNISIEPVYNAIKDFLLGDDKGQEGFLYQFPEGSRFYTEQQVFNDQINTKNKDGTFGRAGTIDLIVDIPETAQAKGQFKPGMRVIIDYKSMAIRENVDKDQNIFKRRQHAVQLGDYKNTLQQAYGIKDVLAYTIVFKRNQTITTNPNTKETTINLKSISVTNPNFRNEERTYMLPVTPEGQSSGNEKVDNLIKSLEGQYSRLYSATVKPEDKLEKIEKLNLISEAIRNLQVALNFEPLSREAIQFQELVDGVLKENETIKENISFQELDKKLGNLMKVYFNTGVYANIDSVFLNEYKEGTLTEKNQKILESLRRSSAAAKESNEKILDIIQRYLQIWGNNYAGVDLLSVEAEVKGIISNLTSSSLIPLNSFRVFTKFVTEARSRDELAAHSQIKELGELYIAAYKENNDVYTAITAKGEHKLLNKTAPDFWKALVKAKQEKNKSFILSNIDKDKYDVLAEAKLKEKLDQIERTVYSTDEEDNVKRRSYETERAKRALDINRKDFNGYEDKTFGFLLKKAVPEGAHYTAEYKALSPGLKKLYDFITELNKRAYASGYLDGNDSTRWLGFIKNTTLQRMVEIGFFAGAKSAISDSFTILDRDRAEYGGNNINPETGKKIKTIQKYFKYEEPNYSKDLVKVVSAYIHALTRYETSQRIENVLNSILISEENKGHLEKTKGIVQTKGGKPEEFQGNDVNARLFQAYVDDQLYGVHVNDNDFLAQTLGKFTTGTEEQQEIRAVTARKVIQNTNSWTQQLAVGMKLVVAIPNYLGAHFQSIVNAGRYYSGWNYEKNHAMLVRNEFGGEYANISKGLLELFVALNEDLVKKTDRQIAWKQSTAKWLGTWTFMEIMMATNSFPDRAHQMTNALSWMDNTIIENGQFVNVRTQLRKEDEERYKKGADGEYVYTFEQRKEMEKSQKARREALLEEKGVRKLAFFNKEGILEIKGVDLEKSNLAEYRGQIIKYGTYITGQMTQEDKAPYRRDILFNSFMMFKNWIPRQVELRAADIHKNPILDEWEYGRTRLFVKALQHFGRHSIGKITSLMKGTNDGLKAMEELLNQKKEDYLKKTGQELTISSEEFYDLMRREIGNELKELIMLLTLLAIALATWIYEPPDDADALTRNQYSTFARIVNKARDEMLFYYNPLSTQAVTNGTIMPSIGLLGKVVQIFDHTGRYFLGDEKTSRDAHALKYVINMFPIASQWQNEWLPYYDPELAKQLGVRTSSQSRHY